MLVFQLTTEFYISFPVFISFKNKISAATKKTITTITAVISVIIFSNKYTLEK